MKIITSEHPTAWWISRRVRCQHCLSVLEFEHGDDIREFEGQLFFVCPDCNKSNTILFNQNHEAQPTKQNPSDTDPAGLPV